MTATLPVPSGDPPAAPPAAHPAPASGPAPLAPITVPGHEVSSYLQYLPAPYAADPFIGRYLMIVERILSTIERTIDNVPYYFDPATTPEELLPWLAGWVGLELDENAPLINRRRALARAAGLYRWQGTRYALRTQLAEYTGQRPLIVENFDGLRLGNDAMLGVNTALGQPRPHSMAITALTDDVGEVDEGVVRRIVESEKPVHVGYSLEIRQHRPPVRSTAPNVNGPPEPPEPPDPYSASEVIQ